MTDDFIHKITDADSSLLFLLPGDQLAVSKSVTLADGRLHKFVQVKTAANPACNDSFFNLALRYSFDTKKATTFKWRPVTDPQSYGSVMKIGKARFSPENKPLINQDTTLPTLTPESWIEWTKFLEDSKLPRDVSRIINNTISSDEAKDELLHSLAGVYDLLVYQADIKLEEASKIQREIIRIKNS